MASVAGGAGPPNQQWASYAGMAYNGASIIGYAGFGFLADAYGRKPVTLFYVAMAFIMVPISFLWAHDLGILLVCAGLLGVFVSGQYTWMSAWLPELFPTRVRAQAVGAFVTAGYSRDSAIAAADSGDLSQLKADPGAAAPGAPTGTRAPQAGLPQDLPGVVAPNVPNAKPGAFSPMPPAPNGSARG